MGKRKRDANRIVAAIEALTEVIRQGRSQVFYVSPPPPRAWTSPVTDPYKVGDYPPYGGLISGGSITTPNPTKPTFTINN